MTLETRVVDLDGPIHYVEFGGGGRPLVLVHGLGGSIENWLAVAPRLTHLGRVVAIDLRGHGRSPLGEGQTATVESNADVLERFLDALFEEPALLVGNSMGAMISMILTGKRPDLVSGLILIDPSISFPDGVDADPVVVSLFATYMEPGVGEEFVTQSAAALGSAEMTRQTLTLCTADVSRVAPEVMQAHIDNAVARESMEWRVDAFLQAARSLVEMKLRRDEYEELIRSLRVPGLLIHGDSDRLIPLAAAEAVAALQPDWAFEPYEDTGHMPQLERPDRVIGSIESWLRAQEVHTAKLRGS